VRDAGKARQLPADVQLVVGDVTRPDTLPAAVDGVDAVVFTLGSDGAGKVGAETVDYGGVRNMLAALLSRPARIALMTSIGVTNPDPTGTLDGVHDTANMPLEGRTASGPCRPGGAGRPLSDHERHRHE
jgi:uncharacterized protein YbjT (DUF2867 family)